jgi:hypothetical protein
MTNGKTQYSVKYLYSGFLAFDIVTEGIVKIDEIDYVPDSRMHIKFMGNVQNSIELFSSSSLISSASYRFEYL